jgi:hypothetical protein
LQAVGYARGWTDRLRAQSHNARRQVMEKCSIFVGLDVHKESIDVSIADCGRSGEIPHYGTIPSDLRSVDALIGKLGAGQSTTGRQFQRLASHARLFIMARSASAPTRGRRYDCSQNSPSSPRSRFALPGGVQICRVRCHVRSEVGRPCEAAEADLKDRLRPRDELLRLRRPRSTQPRTQILVEGCSYVQAYAQ